MFTTILGTFGSQDVIPNLLQSLQRLELADGHFEGVGIVTLQDGCIQHQYTPGTQLDLQNVLQQQPLSGRLGIAYTRPESAIRSKYQEQTTPAVHFYATEHMAVACYGTIDNFSDIDDSLWALGYQFKIQTNAELILRMIQRYLDLDFPPSEAAVISAARVKGFLIVMVLFAKEELLVATRQRCPIAIGMNDNQCYLGSDTKVLSQLSSVITQVEEGLPVVLHPIKK